MKGENVEPRSQALPSSLSFERELKTGLFTFIHCSLTILFNDKSVAVTKMSVELRLVSTVCHEHFLW